MTAGAATVWMAACAPKGIVLRELLIRQADYERMCDLSVSAVTQPISRGCLALHVPLAAHGAAPDRHAPRRARARRLAHERGRIGAGRQGQDRARRAARDEARSARI